MGVVWSNDRLFFDEGNGHSSLTGVILEVAGQRSQARIAIASPVERGGVGIVSALA